MTEQRLASLGVIGASWRAQYYLRIASQLPERFAVRQVLTTHPVICRAGVAHLGRQRHDRCGELSPWRTI